MDLKANQNAAAAGNELGTTTQEEIVGKGESPEMAARMWDSAFNDWVYNGMPKIGDQKYPLGPRPGRHINPNHGWNTDPETYVKTRLKLDDDGTKMYEKPDDIEQY